MVKETLAQAKTRMVKASEDLRVELAGVRTGRASTALLEHLKVEYYGTHTPLNQVATLGGPGSQHDHRAAVGSEPTGND